jgi:hypothetical protein
MHVTSGFRGDGAMQRANARDFRKSSTVADREDRRRRDTPPALRLP